MSTDNTENNQGFQVSMYLPKSRKPVTTHCEYCYEIKYKGWRRKLWLWWVKVTPIRHDEYGWQIGKWNTPISARWYKEGILRCYGIKFDCKYNTICLGRLEIRIWKPKWMRCGTGLYYTRDIREVINKEVAKAKRRGELR